MCESCVVVVGGNVKTPTDNAAVVVESGGGVEVLCICLRATKDQARPVINRCIHVVVVSSIVGAAVHWKDAAAILDAHVSRDPAQRVVVDSNLVCAREIRDDTNLAIACITSAADTHPLEWRNVATICVLVTVIQVPDAWVHIASPIVNVGDRVVVDASTVCAPQNRGDTRAIVHIGAGIEVCGVYIGASSGNCIARDTVSDETSITITSVGTEAKMGAGRVATTARRAVRARIDIAATIVSVCRRIIVFRIALQAT